MFNRKKRKVKEKCLLKVEKKAYGSTLIDELIICVVYDRFNDPMTFSKSRAPPLGSYF